MGKKGLVTEIANEFSTTMERTSASNIIWSLKEERFLQHTNKNTHTHEHTLFLIEKHTRSNPQNTSHIMNDQQLYIVATFLEIEYRGVDRANECSCAKPLNLIKISSEYSRTSMARTLMARLPRLFRTRS